MPIGEEYTFTLLAAEGSRFYVGNDLLIHTERPSIPGHGGTTARTVRESFFATQPLSMNVSGMVGSTLERQTSPFSQAYERAGGAAVLRADPVQALGGRGGVVGDARVSSPVHLVAGKVYKIRVEASTRGGHSADVALFWESARTLQLVPDAFLHPPGMAAPRRRAQWAAFWSTAFPRGSRRATVLLTGEGGASTTTRQRPLSPPMRTARSVSKCVPTMRMKRARPRRCRVVRTRHHNGPYASPHQTDSHVLRLAPTVSSR